MCAAFASCTAAIAQTSGSSALQLKLEPGLMVRGVPAAFTYSIVNASSHDIRLPKPVVNCGDVFFGEVWIHVKFTPVGRTVVPSLERGCTNDYMGHTPALKRAESWMVLHPGESVSQAVSQQQLHYDANKPGSYETWAEYRPPYLSLQEQQKLNKAGIVFPAAELHTPHVHYSTN
jgi:hypothetical protein